MKGQWNNKLFPSLNSINIKSSPYGIKDVLRHYHYSLDTKLGLVIFVVIIFQAFAMPVQQNDLLPRILQLKKHIIIQDMGYYIGASTL